MLEKINNIRELLANASNNSARTKIESQNKLTSFSTVQTLDTSSSSNKTPNGASGLDIHKINCHMCAMKFIIGGCDLSAILKHLNLFHNINDSAQIVTLMNTYYHPQLMNSKSNSSPAIRPNASCTQPFREFSGNSIPSSRRPNILKPLTVAVASNNRVVSKTSESEISTPIPIRIVVTPPGGLQNAIPNIPQIRVISPPSSEGSEKVCKRDYLSFLSF